MTPQDRPPLKNILPPGGTFVLKLIKPKDDKAKAKRFKLNKAGFASCNLFFLDGDGNCLTKNFTAQWPKGLAILVGKFSGKYSPAPTENITVDMLYRYVKPALGQTATVELEVTQDGEWNGKPQYKYKFVKISGPSSNERAIYRPAAKADKPAESADPFTSPDSGAVPF
jgi:hypothetical protein